MVDARTGHRKHRDPLPAHGPLRGHDAPLQGLRDQRERDGRPLERLPRDHGPARAGRAQALVRHGQGHIHHRAGLDCALLGRRKPGHRVPDRVVAYRKQPLDGGRHGFQDHRLHAQRSQPGQHPPLPGRGDQSRGLERVVERPRDHRRHDSGRAHGPDGEAERRGGKHPALSHMDAPGHGRRQRDHRLPDRDVPQRRLGLDTTGRGRHPQRGHHLPSHRPRPGHDPVLPRGRDQQGGQKHLVERGPGLNRRRSARPAAEPARACGRTDEHYPVLGRAGQRRRGADHRLLDPEAQPQRHVDHDPEQDGEHGDHVPRHRPPAGNRLSVPGPGDQLRRTRPIMVAGGIGEHAPRRALRAVQPDSPGGRHVADRPVVERAPQHRRRSDPRLPDRGLQQRRRHLGDHPPQHELDVDHLFRAGPPSRFDSALSRCRDQRGGDRAGFHRRAGDHRRDPAGRAPKPRRGGGRHLGDRPLLAGAHRRWRRQCLRLPDRGF